MKRETRKLPQVVRLYIVNCIAGFALAAVFTALILWFNVVNIAHLVTHVEGGWLAAFVFFVLNGIVFAGVQTGIAIMSLQEDDTPPSGGHGAAVPVVVRVQDTREAR